MSFISPTQAVLHHDRYIAIVILLASLLTACTPIASPTVQSSTREGILPLNEQHVSFIVVDEAYLYWTMDQEPRHIFRYPLAGGTIEKIASTRFNDGDLTSMRPIRNGDWLIFLDTPRSSGYTTWDVRALNLKDRTEQVIVAEPGDLTSWPGPEVTADGDWVVWTSSGRARNKACTETTLAMRNLRSGEQRELERSCIDEGHMWTFPRLSGKYLVVEQDLANNKGGGSDLYLYDLDFGQHQPLTNDGRSSMPMISYPWVVWKAGPRFEAGHPAAIYDLRSGEQRLIRPPGNEFSDPLLAGHWLYWLNLHSIYLYDLETNQSLTINTPKANAVFTDVGISNNTIAWVLDLDPEDAVGNCVLMWQTFP